MDGVYEVENAAFNKFSYGCEILTTRVDGKDYGCVINTAGQITSSDPKKITISCIKANYTCDMVAKAGIFNISILTEDAPYDIFKHFGFQSGRDVDKFADWPDDLRTVNGVRYIGKHTNAVLSARVIDSRDCGTQMLYIAEVVEAHVLLGQAELHLQLLPRPHQAQEGPRASGRRGLDLQGLRLLPRGRGAARGLRLPAVQARPRGLRALCPGRRQQEEGLAVHRLRLLLRGRDSPARLRLPHLPPRRGRLRARRAVSAAA